MIYVTCRLTAKNRDQLTNPTLGNRVWARPTFNQRGVCMDSARFHYTDPTGPDPTRQSPRTLSETHTDPTDFFGDPDLKVWSGPSSGIWLIRIILGPIVLCILRYFYNESCAIPFDKVERPHLALKFIRII